tara:strand:+ start:1005 stop:1481 length:477 start_codon:yes stop_codon:yes gene_type:complete
MKLSKNLSIYIVASTFYEELSDQLIRGATDRTLDEACTIAPETDNLVPLEPTIIKVPGAFEIPGMVKQILDNKNPDLIVTLGVLIKGETNHFEYISESVAHSISKLTISSSIPIIFGVITALNYDQASERALVSKKNKGAEAMETGLKMLDLYDKHSK